MVGFWSKIDSQGIIIGVMTLNEASLDPVRRKMLLLVKERGTNLANVSRAIGKNHAYLHQFIHRKKPKLLPEPVRHALAHHFAVSEEELLSADQKQARMRLKQRLQPQPEAQSSRLHSFAERLAHSRAHSPYAASAAFAQAAGIDLDRYLVLEDGADNPSLDELDRISRVSGSSLEWLIRGGSRVAKTEPSGMPRPDDLEIGRH
jgi:hypothetical protein